MEVRVSENNSEGSKTVNATDSFVKSAMRLETSYGMVSNSVKPNCCKAYGNAEPSPLKREGVET